MPLIRPFMHARDNSQSGPPGEFVYKATQMGDQLQTTHAATLSDLNEPRIRAHRQVIVAVAAAKGDNLPLNVLQIRCATSGHNLVIHGQAQLNDGVNDASPPDHSIVLAIGSLIIEDFGNQYDDDQLEISFSCDRTTDEYAISLWFSNRNAGDDLTAPSPVLVSKDETTSAGTPGPIGPFTADYVVGAYAQSDVDGVLSWNNLDINYAGTQGSGLQDKSLAYSAANDVNLIATSPQMLLSGADAWTRLTLGVGWNW